MLRWFTHRPKLTLWLHHVNTYSHELYTIHSFLLAQLSSRWVGRGIYDLHIVELKHVPFLETLPEGEMIELQAGYRVGSVSWLHMVLYYPDSITCCYKKCSKFQKLRSKSKITTSLSPLLSTGCFHTIGPISRRNWLRLSKPIPWFCWMSLNWYSRGVCHG